ncbi:ATPase, T2SS/T4P/T4SS family [Thalassotalea psychrophila]|uniref:ATPase, T2SS/T4P/T4SS family n=1 Tax=Thalassotalea psychrophila TaxID=3065647 RepID=A0ABY9TVM3_9GAMM|nr:ATPase, T2SS/T4P/T4SS family [Colwelliaceae bacterium SQ149]
MATPKLKLRLGDLLVEENIISDDQLSHALQLQNTTHRKLGDSLIELGFISERQLLQFLAKQMSLPFIDITQRFIAPNVVDLLPEVHARRLRTLVLEYDDDTVLLGMSDPADLNALDQLEIYLAPRELKLAAVAESQIFSAFDNLYRRTAEIESFASQLEEEYVDAKEVDFGAESEGSDATVDKLLQSVFEDAVQMRASDVHIEPEKDRLRIRQRVDGILQESIINQAKIANALVLKLKLMASLDISEKRLPQDGRFHLRIKGHEIDVRMSTMPVQFGESVVMRLLDQTGGIIRLEQTGLPDDLIKRLRLQITRSNGMVLVTGPTGSGKTTTLYAALAELNKPETKIITVEDPVEYRLPRINQVQVSDKIDLSFARVLRTALRQDPDVLMVGEMRDSETVDIGMRGALTGHMVLSTLHTNDAITSAIRLIDMGAPGFLVSSALRAIVAQRLVRRICPSCTIEHELEPQESIWLENLTGNKPSVQFHKGSGCQSCNYSGYRGRVGVFELLELDTPMMNALKNEDTVEFSRVAKQSKGYRPLAVAAYDYAMQGVTTVDEVLRLTEVIDIN